MLRVIAISALGVALVGYCIYFDKKRRMDPDYKRKVHERRELRKKAEAIPEQSSYMNEMKLAEKWFMEGQIEEGVLHLVAALQYSGTPQLVLNAWCQTLPKPIIEKLVDIIKQRRIAMISSNQSSFESMSAQEGFQQASNEALLAPSGNNSFNGFVNNDDID